MTRAALVMSCVSGALALGGLVMVARRPRTAQAVYIRRIAGTMLLAGAAILALFAWGLEKIGG